MNNFRAITATYIQATEKLGAYVKIVDLRHNKVVKVSPFYSSNSDDASDIAEKYLNTKGIKIAGRATNSKGKGYILFTENFENQIK